MLLASQHTVLLAQIRLRQNGNIGDRNVETSNYLGGPHTIKSNNVIHTVNFMQLDSLAIMAGVWITVQLGSFQTSVKESVLVAMECVQKVFI